MLNGFRVILLLFALFFGMAAIGMRYIYKNNNENAWHLTHEGVTSHATITEKHIETSHTTNKHIHSQSSGVDSYILKYSFIVKHNNEEWPGNEKVSKEDYNSVEIGDQFEVIYWPDNPNIATILEDAYTDGAKLAKKISRILMVLSSLFFIIYFKRPLRSLLNKQKN